MMMLKTFKIMKNIHPLNSMKGLNLNKYISKHFSENRRLVKIDKDEKNLTMEQQEALKNTIESFNKFKDFMLKREEYTWEDYLQQIIYTNEKDTTVWKRIRQSKDLEKQEMENTNRFVACLFADEKSSDKFTQQDIDNICKIGELHENWVVKTINDFRLQKGIHFFLREQHRKGEKLPERDINLFEEMDQKYPKIRNEMRTKMYEEIKARLNYTEDHIKKNEQNRLMTLHKKLKRTYKF